jgi:hypothetical protein
LDERDRLWIGHHNGLTRVEGRASKRLSAPRKFTRKVNQSLKKEEHALTPADLEGLLEDGIVFSIAEDRHGHLFLVM